MQTRKASVEWIGDLRNGGGQVSTTSGVLDERPFGFGSRLLNEPGTNPEELLAAAHASCYAMNLSMRLTGLALPPEHLDVSAAVSVEKCDNGLRIVRSALEVCGRVADISAEQFEELAKDVSESCTISRALNIDVTVSATLASRG